MSYWLLFLLLLKASFASFSGLASLPMVHRDLVEHYHVLTDKQLNEAVLAGRSGPGPYGVYLVCAGYQAGGVVGAIEGYIAMLAPAFTVIALVRWVGNASRHPRIERMIRSVLVASAGLLAAITLDLARSGIESAFGFAVAVCAFALLGFTRIGSAPILASAAAAGLVRALFS